MANRTSAGFSESAPAIEQLGAAVAVESRPPTARLYDEIRAQSFSGGVQIVRRYLRQFRADPAASARPLQLKARQVTSWIMQEPTSLEADEQESLQRVLDRCPELNALAGHVRAFAEMMRERRGDRLARWMDDVRAHDLPDLRSFVGGVRRDQDAVVAGLTLSWSSGPVEGHVNRSACSTRTRRPAWTAASTSTSSDYANCAGTHRYGASKRYASPAENACRLLDPAAVRPEGLALRCYPGRTDGEGMDTSTGGGHREGHRAVAEPVSRCSGTRDLDGREADPGAAAPLRRP
ncbi:MAG: transposase [Chloroflexi bacterium]|nr:MAG: transposase [Chloroflexota bacterium]